MLRRMHRGLPSPLRGLPLSQQLMENVLPPQTNESPPALLGVSSRATAITVSKLRIACTEEYCYWMNGTPSQGTEFNMPETYLIPMFITSWLATVKRRKHLKYRKYRVRMYTHTLECCSVLREVILSSTTTDRNARIEPWHKLEYCDRTSGRYLTEPSWAGTVAR